ncbi:hypothetical protein P343_17440 [Sporolactobacillus laevolacticus DSM 442]|uniref:Uncharacterized protein n=1 Tax=Sporolactobacillus laevolacticus DSM 442 TaxID=1395513 RepID=V6IV83_9BACL|nr:hypothetical protein P343_17440 [Sporolactobacillus laevolacticus DSM 442]
MIASDIFIGFTFGSYRKSKLKKRIKMIGD